jgi:hypothetical protein
MNFSFFCSQIVIKLNIKFGRRSISLRELRSHFDHAPEADDHQGLGRYAIDFVLELAGCIMFLDHAKVTVRWCHTGIFYFYNHTDLLNY